MVDHPENFQSQFSGFFNTPHLFKSSILNINIFDFQLVNSFTFNKNINSNTRLGLRVEQFVFEELKQFQSFSILAENIQIQENINHTIGELDCIYKNNQQAVHLEIQYKFYLYDGSISDNEIDCLIGPRRRDSLIEKLNKLQSKQLPLLYSKHTKPLLDRLQLEAKDVTQQIYFKAQVFVPYGETVTFKTINNACVYGFYFNYEQLDEFSDCKFYIPKKMDWLLDLNPQVNWLTFNQVTTQLAIYKAENQAPLLWLKYPNGQMTKCFVVTW